MLRLRSSRFLWLPGLCLGSLLSCDGQPAGPGPRDPVHAVEIVVTTPTVAVGETVDLRAVVRDGEGTELSGRTVHWSTASTATLELGSREGSSVRVRGLVPGIALVSASSEGVDRTVEIVVVGGVETVDVVPASSNMVQGANSQFEAFAKDARNTLIPNPLVRWTTSNGGIVTVTASGLVSAVGMGTAQITATVDDKSGVAQVIVTAAPVATVAITPDPGTVAVGRSVQFRAALRDASGNELAGRPVIWTSSDPAVLAVDSAGNATGRTVGTVIVTATSESKSGTAAGIVMPPSALTIEVAPAARSIGIGDTVQYRAALRDANGNFVTGRPVSWTSSDPAIATITGLGVATGVGHGTATITATADGQTGNTEIAVRAGVPQLLAITPDTAIAGRAADLTLTVTGSSFTATSRIRWNGTDRPTTYVNGGQLQGIIPASDLATGGTAEVTVFTPPPGGGTSAPAVFRVRGTGLYTPGDTATGLLAQGGVDEWTFVGSAGQEINVYFQAGSGDGDDVLQLSVSDPSGSVLGTVASRGNDPVLEDQTIGRMRLPRTGTYTVRMKGVSADAAGLYRFLVSLIDLDPERIAAAVQLGAVVSGEEIAPVGDIDQFTFSASAGQDVNAFFQATSGSSSDELFLHLLSPLGTLVASVYSSGDVSTLVGQNSGLVSLPHTGTYLVRVHGRNSSNDGGPYRFQVVAVDRGPERLSATVEIGAEVSGEDIAHPGDVDRFSFSGTAGQEMNVYFQATGGSANEWLRLGLTDGTTGASLGGILSDGSNRSLEGQSLSHVKLAHTGVYHVDVWGHQDKHQGPYRFRLSLIDTAPEKLSPAVAMSTVVIGEDLSPVGDVDDFTFTGTAGQEIEVQLQATSGSQHDELYLFVLSPTGAQIGSVYSQGNSSTLEQQSTGRLTLTHSGTYRLRIQGENASNDSGSYAFRIKVLLAP